MAVEFHKVWLDHCQQREAYYALPVVGEASSPPLAAGTALLEDPVRELGSSGDTGALSSSVLVAGPVRPSTFATPLTTTTAPSCATSVGEGHTCTRFDLNDPELDKLCEDVVCDSWPNSARR